MLGLGSDFFLQMFFFTTVLSIDIRRMEVCCQHMFPNISNGLVAAIDEVVHLHAVHNMQTSIANCWSVAKW